ncbi:MAG: zinc ribbon domain-containing protein [Ruminococcus sp.]|jgi:predicted amidophosphoribosyltransferase|nr:zinc ribbon domain-containing protein [Ruminococcus sp.]
MATYKQPCINCGEFIDRNSNYCPKCQTANPFVFQCAFCKRQIEQGDKICGGCGKSLSIFCPKCGEELFATLNCVKCGEKLIYCTNPKCGALNSFQNKKCEVCKKKIMW